MNEARRRWKNWKIVEELEESEEPDQCGVVGGEPLRRRAELLDCRRGTESTPYRPVFRFFQFFPYAFGSTNRNVLPRGCAGS
jgi:hypothetical protein